MARRVFLHLGSPKSGTTYLQDILWRNREILRSQGVLLPARRVDNFFASMTVRGVPGIEKRQASAATAWSRIVEETRVWPETVIISHEFFGGASAEGAARALDDLAPAEVHLVVTAREYSRVLPAAWQEWVKIGYTRSLEDFLHKGADGGPHSEWGWRTSDVVAILDRWGRHVPSERVHVVTVPSAGASPDLLWRRFAGLCGIDPDSCDLGGARPNESLGAPELEFLRRVNPHVTKPIKGAPGEVTRWHRDWLARTILAARSSNRRVVLSSADARFLHERSRQAAQDLAVAGYDVVGDLEELCSAPLGSPNDADVTDADLVDVAARVCADMLQEYRTESLRADRERRRADRAEKQLAALGRDVEGPSADRAGATPGDGPAWTRRRVRDGLVRLSERHPPVMRARVLYRRAVDSARGRVGRR